VWIYQTAVKGGFREYEKLVKCLLRFGLSSTLVEDCWSAVCRIGV